MPHELPLEASFPVKTRISADRARRNINSMIRANDRSEKRWWANNRDIIACLDAGQPVAEIARLLGRGKRQIRVVRERLADIRQQAAG